MTLRALMVFRLDVGGLKSPEKLPNGWLRADAYLTRSGIFEYLKADGTIHRELRPPEEVFAPESLASFAMVPVTDDHPAEGRLDAANAPMLARGAVGDSVRRDGEKVRAPMLVTDGALIAKMLAGQSQVSCGYTCELDEMPGTWQGERYDAVQRNIRGNHVAIVQRGRAGESIRVRLDTSDARQVLAPHQAEKEASDPSFPEVTVLKIRIDGVECEVSETAAQLIAKIDAASSKAIAEKDAAMKLALGEAEKAKARADHAEAELAKEKKARADAEDPKRLHAAIRARVSLEQKARLALGAEVKLDEMDEHAVKVAVLAKTSPDLKLDGKSPEYVAAAYDLAIERLDQATPGLDDARRVLVRDDSDGKRVDAKTARAAYVDAQEKRGRAPLTIGATLDK